MSALTEKVAREHRHTWIDPTTLVCSCGEPMPGPYARDGHLIAVTEAATRAAVAAEIDALADRMEAEEVNAAYLIGLSDAASIAERSAS